ncbi:MAG: ABC transporter substrate-binding protein [Planctomycetota bacterium]
MPVLTRTPAPARPAVQTGRPVRRAGALALLAFALAALAAGVPTPALPAADADVLVVRSSDAGPYKEAEQKIHDRLAAAGHAVDETNLADLSAEDGAALKARLQAETVRLYVAVGTQAAEWLHEHLPAAAGMVYCMVSDPERAGLLKGNPCAGISTTIAPAEQIKLILAALPNLHSIGLLYSRKDANSTATMNSFKAALPAGVTLDAIALEDCAGPAEAVQKLLDAKPDFIWTDPDPAVFNPGTIRNLLLGALQAKIPIFGFSAAFVRAGALLGVGVEPVRQGDQCGQLGVAYFAALKDKKEAEFFQTRRLNEPNYEIAVNTIAANQLGQALPQDFLARADIVYK